jgi:Prefoldin subunit
MARSKAIFLFFLSALKLIMIVWKANVMLSYSLPQAITLLRSKLDTAEGTLQGVMVDLEFLREQITVMEVNTARLYNWDVKRRRERREKGQLPGPKAGG